MTSTTSSIHPTDCSHCSQSTQDGLGCDRCKQWWCKDCINQSIPQMLTDELYTALDDVGEFPWECPTCTPDTILQQLVSNGTYSMDELDAFGCNKVILEMIKTMTDDQSRKSTTPPLNPNAATFQSNHTEPDPDAANTSQQANGTTSALPNAMDQATMQMMMLQLMQTMAQNQQQQGKKISNVVVPNLPKVQLPKFDGDLLQWTAFWESFEINVHSQAIPDRQKMDYLRQLVKGPALNKIRGLGLNGNRYNDAIQTLKDHYGNPLFQKRAQWDNLHSLPPVRDNLNNLERFNDELRSAILAMQQCGIDSTALNGYVPEIMKKLPTGVMMEMHRVRMMQDKSMEDVTMDDLVNFIQRFQQMVMMSCGKPTPHRKPDQPMPDKLAMDSSTPRMVPTMALAQNIRNSTHTRSENNIFCVFCQDNNHYSDECQTISDASARRQILTNEDRCFNCLRQEHNRSQCRQTKPCFHCRTPGHHAATCTNRTPDFTLPKQSMQLSGQFNDVATYNNDNTTPDSPDQSIHMQVHLNHNGQNDGIVMAAFPCQVMNPETKKLVNLMVYADGGARRTCISKEAASKLNLNTTQSVTLDVGRFNSKDEDKVHADVVNATLQGPNGFKLDITAYSVPETAPPLKVGPIRLNRTAWSQVNKTNPINCPPRTETSHPIDILLGQDYYHTVLGPQVKATRIQHDLYAYHTKLGNILYGNSKNNPQMPNGQAFHNMTCSIQAIHTTVMISATDQCDPPEVNRMSDGNQPETQRKSTGTKPKEAGSKPEVAQKRNSPTQKMVRFIQGPNRPADNNTNKPKTVPHTTRASRPTPKFNKTPIKDQHRTARIAPQKPSSSTLHPIKSLLDLKFDKMHQWIHSPIMNNFCRNWDLRSRPRAQYSSLL